tara:strand:+ start:477 stop:788 length:312 start_codon:yes stop_codon:yes gene_type:complete
MLSRIVLTVARRLVRNLVKYAGPDSKCDKKSQKYVAHMPFKELRIDTQVSWGDGGITAKPLGCYEQKISGVMASIRGASFDAVINIGSAVTTAGSPETRGATN